MKSFFAVMISLVFAAVSAPGYADTKSPSRARAVPAELTGYNDIIVEFSNTAEECNLTDAAMFEKRLRDKFAGLKIIENPNSIITINLGISAQAFGPFNTECTSVTEIALNTMLTSQNIVTESGPVRAALDRLGRFPVTLYKDARFAVQALSQPSAGGKSVEAQKAVLKMIDLLVARIGELR